VIAGNERTFTDLGMWLVSQLEPHFDPAIDNASLDVSINLSEGSHLVRRENDLAKAPLASVCDVFEINKTVSFSDLRRSSLLRSQCR